MQLNNAASALLSFVVFHAGICLAQSTSLSISNSDEAYQKAVLGFQYQQGYLVEPNQQKASELFWEAALQKNPLGIYGVADMVSHGKGGNAHNEEKAALLFNRVAPLIEALAKSGDLYAQTAMGRMYQLGQGVEKDDFKSAKWYHQAANKGYPPAQYCLGYMYQNGSPYALDNSELNAILWYRKAAVQGYALAQKRLNSISKARPSVHPDSEEVHAALQDMKSSSTKAENRLEIRAKVTRLTLLSDNWFKNSGTDASVQGIKWVYKNVGIGVEVGLPMNWKVDRSWKTKHAIYAQELEFNLKQTGNVDVIPLGLSIFHTIPAGERAQIILEAGGRYLLIDSHVKFEWNGYTYQAYTFGPGSGYMVSKREYTKVNDVDIGNSAVGYISADFSYELLYGWNIFAGGGYQFDVLSGDITFNAILNPEIWGPETSITDKIEFAGLFVHFGLSRSF